MAGGRLPGLKTGRFAIPRLGPATLDSPLAAGSPWSFVSEGRRLPVDPYLDSVRDRLARGEEVPSFEVAGPRSRIYFEPAATRAAIVTCGGLSPGLNDVIRALVRQLVDRYGVGEVVGVRHGLHGFVGERGPEWMPLDLATVEAIDRRGGSILGTSRGSPGTERIVDALVQKEIDILFAIGGDGTMRAAAAVAGEVRRRGLAIAIVGLPKTIDNDIPYVRRSFGFETAVMLASVAVRSARTEAGAVRNGVGLVKLMGRHSGYIAAAATLASAGVDFCLVPEVPFSIEGEGGLLDRVEERLAQRERAVLVVAEGAGQEYLSGERGRDASGNRRLGDIGGYLRRRLEEGLAERGCRIELKYIDPSYLIRSAPANPSDSLFCARLAQNAVHAAMAGKTELLIGYWHGLMTHVPLAALEGESKTIDPHGELWRNVLETTGQRLA
ncbi:MAG: ATP-dependent 6-phosphofructokinase [Thermoanaerobaculia bacterium]|nr:ATP-dependent 6-phosphofructokinase [Thermoanaerobaculia bacterium]